MLLSTLLKLLLENTPNVLQIEIIFRKLISQKGPNIVTFVEQINVCSDTFPYLKKELISFRLENCSPKMTEILIYERTVTHFHL